LGSILIERFEVSQSLSSGRSEKHSSQTLSFTIPDGTGNKIQVSIHKWLLHLDLVLLIVIVHLDRHGSLKLWSHILYKLDDMKIILKFVNVLLHFFDCLALFGNELLVILNIVLNCVEKQMHGLLLHLTDLSNVSCERINISRLVDFDIVVLTLLDEILDSPFSLVA
jgi:hypothetical protein